jgi:murein DD-endopeptidase MepM/ murein hydrolase activator NlpD
MNKKILLYIVIIYIIYKLLKGKNFTMNTQLIPPLEKYSFNSAFGRRWGNQWHNGVDLGAPNNTPILASHDSEVIAVGYNNLSGNYIKLQSLVDPSLSFGYAHLIKPSDLKIGDKVAQKDVIGFVGSTGKSNGPHLHWVVRKNGKEINPETVIKLR